MCDNSDGKIYDNLPRFYFDPTSSTDYYTDYEKALEYQSEITGWDYDTQQKGTRFSVIYSLCGITMALLSVSNCCLILGAWSLYARMAGLCFACCLGCVNVAAIVTTGVFRYNTMGKLAAISLAPSKYDDSSTASLYFTDPNGRVYKDDANLI